MSLSCDCDWADIPEVYRSKTVTARIQHKCEECRKDIMPGEQYEYAFGVWDGIPQSFYTCEKCTDLQDSMSALGFCMERGSLLNDHAEYLEEYAPPKMVPPETGAHE